METILAWLIFLAGAAQLCVLIAAALVPLQLDWKNSLAILPRLHRQMIWVYASYIVLGITANGLVSLCFSRELAEGSGLARAVAGYIAVFWGIRLCLQTVLEAKPFLTKWWLRAGYHTLTVLFTFFTAVFGFAALRLHGS